MEDPLMEMENIYQYSLRHATKEMMDKTFTAKTWAVDYKDDSGKPVCIENIDDYGHAFEVYEIALSRGWTDIVMYETFVQKSIVKYEHDLK